MTPLNSSYSVVAWLTASPSRAISVSLSVASKNHRMTPPGAWTSRAGRAPRIINARAEPCARTARENVRPDFCAATTSAASADASAALNPACCVARSSRYSGTGDSPSQSANRSGHSTRPSARTIIAKAGAEASIASSRALAANVSSAPRRARSPANRIQPAPPIIAASAMPINAALNAERSFTARSPDSCPTHRPSAAEEGSTLNHAPRRDAMARAITRRSFLTYGTKQQKGQEPPGPAPSLDRLPLRSEPQHRSGCTCRGSPGSTSWSRPMPGMAPAVWHRTDCRHRR